VTLEAGVAEGLELVVNRAGKSRCGGSRPEGVVFSSGHPAVQRCLPVVHRRLPGCCMTSRWQQLYMYRNGHVYVSSALPVTLCGGRVVGRVVRECLSRPCLQSMCQLIYKNVRADVSYICHELTCCTSRHCCICGAALT